MMSNQDYQHFVCIVAGENPDELMKPYDLKTEMHVVYKFKDADRLRLLYIQDYQDILNDEESNLSETEKEYIKLSLKEITEMDSEEFFYDVTEGLEHDPITHDAMSNINEKGKWYTYSLGKFFSVPFLTKEGKEAYQTRKCDIDWDKIHNNNKEIYERVWEMVMDNSEPQNEYEEQIYENMKDKTEYFNKFETKENYVTSNTAFWGYAFLSEMTGWMEPTNKESQFAWMSNFYDVFIKNLDDNTLLTIYECRKKF